MNINEVYKDYIKSLPCHIPGCRGESQPHHVIHRGMGGAKRDDYTCIALCNMHHSQYHMTGRSTFEAQYGLDFDKLIFENLVGYIIQQEVRIWKYRKDIEYLFSKMEEAGFGVESIGLLPEA